MPIVLVKKTIQNQANEVSLHSPLGGLTEKVQELRKSDAKLREIIEGVEVRIREILSFNEVCDDGPSASQQNPPSPSDSAVGAMEPLRTMQVPFFDHCPNQIVLDTAVELSIADLKMDLLARKVWRNGKMLALKPLEFKLLEYMLRHPNRVLTRDALLQNVWGYEFDPHTNFLEVHISNLRKKIDRNSGLRLLRTVRNIGYTLSDTDA